MPTATKARSIAETAVMTGTTMLGRSGSRAASTASVRPTSATPTAASRYRHR